MAAAAGAICLLDGGLSSAAGAACPNQSLRQGPSALLPDCRAYELVTPGNSGGRRVGAVEFGLSRNLFADELASPGGDSFVYFLQGGPLVEPEGANGAYDRYEARRSASGWETVRRLSPSGAEAVFPNAGGVSPDHQYSFTNVTEGDAGSLGAGGEANYLGNPDGSFELIGRGSLGEERLAEGRWISAGGAHVIFSTGGPVCSGLCEVKQLEPNAPPTETPAVYDRAADGPTHVVSLLPGDDTPAAGEAAEYQGASADGSVVAFSVAGVMYVRVDNQLTEEVAAGEPTFSGLSSHGERLYYLLGGDAFAFDTATEATTRITSSGDVEPVNVSADGSHLYFVSPSQLDGSSGALGEPNLYVWSEAGGVSFIATVAPEDLEGTPALSNWATRVVPPRIGEQDGPGANSSRTTPDGSVLVFQSRAQLTPYENGGRVEIYRYDDGAGTLLCVSCNPGAEPAAANARLEPVEIEEVSTRTIVHNVTDDGATVFFETAEPLVGRDTDGLNDVYEWSVDGQGQARLDLISSGTTPDYGGFASQANVLVGVTPNGGDVFFKTVDALVPTAGTGGVPAIYDAAAGGGFASRDQASCSGDPCQPPPAPGPALDRPSSNAFSGKGNVRRRHHRCRRHGHSGKHHKRRRCGRGHHR